MIKEDYGIKAIPIAVRNPQAHAIVERIHQVVGNIIRTFELEDNYLDEDDPWKGILRFDPPFTPPGNRLLGTWCLVAI